MSNKISSMEKRSLRIAAVTAIAVCMVIGFSGCGSDSASNGSTGESSENADTGSVESASAGSEGSSNEAGELTTVREAVITNSPDQWIALLGTQQGIMEKYGLELEISEFAAGINTVDAIATDQADIGSIVDYALVNRIGNTLEETDIKIISRLSNMSDSYGLYVNPDKVSSLSDLAGQGLVTITGTVFDYWNAVLLEEAGLTEDEVEIVSVESASAGLAVMTSGDAVAKWATGISALKLEEAGMVEFSTLADYDLNNMIFYVSTDEYIAENADTLAAFYEASAETIDWIVNNMDEAAEIAGELLDLETEEVLVTMESYSFTLDYNDEVTKALGEIEEWAYENGCFDTEYDVADFVNTETLQSVFPDRVD